MAQDSQRSWSKTTVWLYGRKVKLWYQSIDALWYSSAKSRLLRIVVVRDPHRRRRDDCFFSTDLTLTPPRILEASALRWPLEVCSAMSSSSSALKTRKPAFPEPLSGPLP